MNAALPLRLQLSRAKGFDLQAASLATNGLPARGVARPSKFGNLWIVGLAKCGCRAAGECTHNFFRCETAAEAVAEHRRWLGDGHHVRRHLALLRGHNVACWCALDAPCHGDNWLDLANR